MVAGLHRQESLVTSTPCPPILAGTDHLQLDFTTSPSAYHEWLYYLESSGNSMKLIAYSIYSC